MSLPYRGYDGYEQQPQIPYHEAPGGLAFSSTSPPAKPVNNFSACSSIPKQSCHRMAAKYSTAYPCAVVGVDVAAGALWHGFSAGFRLSALDLGQKKYWGPTTKLKCNARVPGSSRSSCLVLKV